MYPVAKGTLGLISLSLQLPAYSVKVGQSGWVAAVCEEQKPAEFRVGAGVGMGRFPTFLPRLSTWQKALDSDHRGGQVGPLPLPLSSRAHPSQ